jgi:hypothetical protein
MTVAMAPANPNPIQLNLNAPLKVARWRVIGNPIMAIPHIIVLYVLNLVLSVITFIAWFAILFTGTYPPGMFDLAAGIMRYQWRVGTFYLFMREPYPPSEYRAVRPIRVTTQRYSPWFAPRSSAVDSSSSNGSSSSPSTLS